MHCFLPMVVPVVERLERRGCYMMSRTGSGCPWRAGSVRETLNERNMAESAVESGGRPTATLGSFASGAINSSVGHALAM